MPPSTAPPFTLSFLPSPSPTPTPPSSSSQTTMATEDLSSLFRYQGNIEELKQKLIHTTYELQLARIQANEETRKNRETMENMKQLLRLLEMAYNERDQARTQIKKLLLTSFDSATSAAKPPPVLSPETTLLSSSMTESASNGDSLYDDVSPLAANTDPESLIIYNLATARPLPQKGKLLQAVMEAGPLLQTLMVAGELPRWRNPPQPQAPPVNLVRFDGGDQGTHLVKRTLNFAGAGDFGVSPLGMGFRRRVMPSPKRQRIR